jgi:hypothetical protein
MSTSSPLLALPASKSGFVNYPGYTGLGKYPKKENRYAANDLESIREISDR